MKQLKQCKPIKDDSVQEPAQYEVAQSPDCIKLQPEEMEEFLDYSQEHGCSAGTLQMYRRNLEKLYNDLPEDKLIRPGFMDRWLEYLLEEGYSPSTVNGFLSVGNSFLGFVNYPELQTLERVEMPKPPRPELTHEEYLRLLQTAKDLGKEECYLLVKIFANMPLNVQELSKITLDAAAQGHLAIQRNGVKKTVVFPRGLQAELLDFANREGRTTGPLFIKEDGTPIHRTHVCAVIRQLCPAAQVSEEKVTPRCLQRFYKSNRSTIQSSMVLLVGQSTRRQLETERFSVGWNA